jgi:hypothetical protein
MHGKYDVKRKWQELIDQVYQRKKNIFHLSYKRIKIITKNKNKN